MENYLYFLLKLLAYTATVSVASTIIILLGLVFMFGGPVFVSLGESRRNFLMIVVIELLTLGFLFDSLQGGWHILVNIVLWLVVKFAWKSVTLAKESVVLLILFDVIGFCGILVASWFWASALGMSADIFSALPQMLEAALK